MLAIVFVGACVGCVLQRVCCVWLQTTLYFQSIDIESIDIESIDIESIDIDKSDTEASLVCTYCFTSCLFTIIEVQGRRDYFFGEISVFLKLNYNQNVGIESWFAFYYRRKSRNWSGVRETVDAAAAATEAHLRYVSQS